MPISFRRENILYIPKSDCEIIRRVEDYLSYFCTVLIATAWKYRITPEIPNYILSYRITSEKHLLDITLIRLSYKCYMNYLVKISS